MNKTQIKAIGLLAFATAIFLFMILFLIRATVPVVVNFSETVGGLPELAAALVALGAVVWIFNNL